MSQSTGTNPLFALPDKVERCLASLSKLYAQQGKRELQQLIVNAQVRVQEGYSYDNWDGGTHGHALHLVVPESIYLANIETDLKRQIAEDINKLHNVQNEFIHEVFLEMDVPEDANWRKDSGLLIAGARQVGPEAVSRIWSEGDFRLFLSHKSEVKRETATLRDEFKFFGVSAFVAHDDIQPTKEWQDEIENALATMDGFVALLTADFHESDWTDQEVGFALARGVPIIAVRLGRNPYGFLGKFQGLAADWATAAVEVVKLLMRNDRMLSAYIKALRRCQNFDRGNTLSLILPSIPSMSEKQVDEVIDAFNQNQELQGSFGFSGTKSTYWGNGLIPHLHRWGSRRFDMSGGFPRKIVAQGGKAGGATQTRHTDEIPF